LRHEEQTRKEHHRADQASEEVKNGCAHDQRHKEQLSLCSKDGQRPIDRLVRSINSPFSLHINLEDD
jgi:hypothetical protein